MRWRRVIAGLALVGLLHARADAQEPIDPAERTQRARQYFESGHAHFKLGDWEGAIREFEAGYALKPLPLFLYNLGQAARRASQPARAVAYYKRFLEADPNTPERAEVEQILRELGSFIAAEQPPPAPPPPAAAQAEPPKKWQRDPVGAVLMGAGLGAVVTSLGLLGWSGYRLAHAEDSYEAFIEARGAVGVRDAAAVTLCAGVVLTVGGTVRWLIVRQR
jgi:tetratricopeptide (TPR) repeat protein